MTLGTKKAMSNVKYSYFALTFLDYKREKSVHKCSYDEIALVVFFPKQLLFDACCLYLHKIYHDFSNFLPCV